VYDGVLVSTLWKEVVSKVSLFVNFAYL